MRPKTIARRHRQREAAAVNAVRHGMALRKAENIFGHPRSTLHRRVKTQLRAALPTGLPRAPGRPPALSASEGKVFVDLLLRYADQGTPLSKLHLEEAFAILIARMTEDRRLRLPFRDGRPGRKFLSAFALRHYSRLRFAKPTRQEGKRFAVSSADAFTTHFATLARLVEEQNLDASRIWNLDETGGTPGKRYIRRLLFAPVSAPRWISRREDRQLRQCQALDDDAGNKRGG